MFSQKIKLKSNHMLKFSCNILYKNVNTSLLFCLFYLWLCLNPQYLLSDSPKFLKMKGVLQSTFCSTEALYPVTGFLCDLEGVWKQPKRQINHINTIYILFTIVCSYSGTVHDIATQWSNKMPCITGSNFTYNKDYLALTKCLKVQKI